jgi:hypothetical protein
MPSFHCISYYITDWLTIARSEVLEMLIVPQLVNKFFTVHVAQRFIRFPDISELYKQQYDIQEF